MTHNIDLNKLILILKEVKSTTRETADASVSEKLDYIIGEIEALQESSQSNDEVKRKALFYLDYFFKACPSIAKLMDWFSG